MQIPQIFLTLLLISVCTFFTAKLKNDRLKRSENKYRDFTQQELADHIKVRLSTGGLSAEKREFLEAMAKGLKKDDLYFSKMVYSFREKQDTTDAQTVKSMVELFKDIGIGEDDTDRRSAFQSLMAQQADAYEALVSEKK